MATTPGSMPRNRFFSESSKSQAASSPRSPWAMPARKCPGHARSGPKRETPGSSTGTSTGRSGGSPRPGTVSIPRPGVRGGGFRTAAGQDRTAVFVPSLGKGDLRLCWPSDERPNKAHQTASVFLATLPSSASLPAATPKNG